MDYKPKPIDTSQVKLTGEIEELTERLAENTHDIWARQRMAEGWRYGPARNDAAKEHPCLVEYKDLPESEKEYDRKTAVETIKALLGMGYRIEPPQARAAGTAQGEAADVADLRGNLDTLDLPALLARWEARNPQAWARTPDIYPLLGKKILEKGEPLVAYDVFTEGHPQCALMEEVRRKLAHTAARPAPRKPCPGSLQLHQQMALALARSGATELASGLLEQLCQQGECDEETLGLLARTHKDLWARARGRPEAAKHLRRATERYTEAHVITGGYWTGINAATMSLLLGKKEQAAVLARDVRELCDKELAKLPEGSRARLWPLATLGEAALILGEWDEAEQWYGRAVELAPGDWGSLLGMRRNARYLGEHQGGDLARLERIFRIPAVGVFVGHMIDQPNRVIPRFPPELEGAVREAIRERLEKRNVRIGYASAACGSDILFHEAMLERKAETHVILPFERNLFRQDSVDIVPGADWRARYERVLAGAAHVQQAATERMQGGSASYEYANLFLHGLASLRAEQMETEVVPLAVWDGRPGDGSGGTAWAVERWRSLGYDVEWINLEEVLGQVCKEKADVAASAPRPEPPRPMEAFPEFTPKIRGLLFADAVGFSQLTEREVPLFVRHFLAMVGKLVHASKYKPLVKNTWGDGLYCVFEDVHDAGQFALELSDLVQGMDWAGVGLPELILRIGVHAGPVYYCKDPVTRQQNYIGAQVSRAARIEPITPPGQVYASQAFAALAAAERLREFRCDYVGVVSQAKKYGNFPTYVVRRDRQ